MDLPLQTPGPLHPDLTKDLYYALPICRMSVMDFLMADHATNGNYLQMNEDILGKTISQEEFDNRFVELHRQLWCSTEFSFNEVTQHVFSPPKGWFQADHSFFYDGENWHLYYVTGNMLLTEEWGTLVGEGKHEAAGKMCFEPGNGHALGRTLFDLSFIENVCFDSQGGFDTASRGVCSLFRHDERYGMLYDVRGTQGELLSLAWSDDLHTWTLGNTNPVLGPAPWANPKGAFKDPHVMEWNGIHLIYAVAWTRNGQVGVCLLTTDDWETFHDHGMVFTTPPSLRGTFGLESPQVVHHDGMWHLFYTWGPGLWHAVSPSPTGFQADTEESNHRKVMRGPYLMGPFHATELVQDGDQWWLTTDRKEETRRLNREAGRLCPRGSYEDEKTLEEGIYLSSVKWVGDRPVFEKPILSS